MRESITTFLSCLLAVLVLSTACASVSSHGGPSGSVMGLSVHLAQAPAGATTPYAADLHWEAVTVDVDGQPVTGVTYAVYAGLTGQLKKLYQGNFVGLGALVPNLPSGQTTCFDIVASAPGRTDSAHSNEVCMTVNVASLATPILTIGIPPTVN